MTESIYRHYRAIPCDKGDATPEPKWLALLGPAIPGNRWVHYCPCGHMDVCEERPDATCSQCGAGWILHKDYIGIAYGMAVIQ